VFIDSNVALGTLLRGASRRASGFARPGIRLALSRRQHDWNALVSDIWFEAARGGHALAALRVPSRLNLSDAGTRRAQKKAELRAMYAAGFVRVAWEWPPCMPGLRQ
jgi:hypothetical protein